MISLTEFAPNKTIAVAKKLSFVFILTLLVCFDAPPEVAHAIRVKEVLIFLGGSVVGGAVCDGLKWTVRTYVASAGTAVAAASGADLAAVGVMGLSLYGIYINNKGYVEHYKSEAGCVMYPGDDKWVCPKTIPITYDYLSL